MVTPLREFYLALYLHPLWHQVKTFFAASESDPIQLSIMESDMPTRHPMVMVDPMVMVGNHGGFLKLKECLFRDAL